jgi:CelD/BcsL family acetyltransferase involved in cellulose biosynthesis
MVVLESNKHVLLDASDELWVAFAASSPRANIFHHPAWMNLLAECYGYRPFVVAVRNADGKICAGLPMMEVNSRLTSRRWVSLPFTDHCEPLYNDYQSLNQLTEALAHLYQDGSTPRIELRWAFPTHPAIQSYSHYVLHTLKLDADAKLVASRFRRTNRQSIRAAEDRGVRIEWGEKLEHLQAFYRLQLDTRRRKGIPVQPWRFFDLLRRRIIEQGLGFILLAYKEDQCLAAGVFLHWQQTLTYKYAASRTDGLNLRPNNLMLWTAIRWGCENGYTLLDMGRTDIPNTGLRNFKNGWGTEEVPLIYSTLPATPPQLMTGKLMRVMQTVIRNSPVWVCRAAGELLYGHVG